MSKRDKFESKLEAISDIIGEETVIEEMEGNYSVSNVEFLSLKELVELVEYLQFEYTVSDETVENFLLENKELFTEDNN